MRIPHFRYSGNARDGIGVPGCIRLGRAAARSLLACAMRIPHFRYWTAGPLLAGNARDGIGVPGCIRLGRAAARSLLV
jgi:protoporphyrinogen oxidase